VHPREAGHQGRRKVHQTQHVEHIQGLSPHFLFLFCHVQSPRTSPTNQSRRQASEGGEKPHGLLKLKQSSR